MKKLVSTLDMPRDEWLMWRRKGIGGSDAAGIVGVSKWATPFSIYLDKMGFAEEQPDNEILRQGRDFEAYVARRFSEKSGKKVRCCNAVLAHDDYEFLLANIDRMVVGEAAGLECKTMNPRSAAASLLEDGEIPPQYYAQCQHYMMVTGYHKWYISILVYGKEPYHLEISRNDAYIATLQAEEIAFWNDFIVPEIMPEPDYSSKCSDALKALYPRAEQGKAIYLPGAKDTLVGLADVNAQIKTLEEQKNLLENILRNEMQDAETGHADGWRVTLKNYQRKSIDSKALKDAHPDIYEQYTKTSAYRRLIVKEEA